jgi:membrane associated rhomboid family serine protease
MFPLKDDNPLLRTPVVTIALIAVNCLVFLYQITLSSQGQQLFFLRYGLIPIEITHMADMTPQAPFPVLLSPFSSMFVHGDLLHLGGNMLYLWIFGNNVEDYLGRFKFLGFYFLSGLAAVALFAALSPNSQVPLIGASGAIAGILGAYMVLFPRARVLTLIWIIFIIRLIWLPAVFLLGYWFVIQLIMGASTIGESNGGGVAWFAHIGGFGFGWLVIRLFRRSTKNPYTTDSSYHNYYNRWH